MRPSIRLTGVLLLALVACSDSPTELVDTSPDGPGMLLVTTGVPLTQVSAGDFHGCGLETDPLLGRRRLGQVSNAPMGTGFKQVSAGGGHVCALEADGSIDCWGYDFSSPVNITMSYIVMGPVAGALQGVPIRTATGLPTTLTTVRPPRTRTRPTATTMGSGTCARTVRPRPRLAARTRATRGVRYRWPWADRTPMAIPSPTRGISAMGPPGAV